MPRYLVQTSAVSALAITLVAWGATILTLRHTTERVERVEVELEHLRQRQDFLRGVQEHIGNRIAERDGPITDGGGETW